MKARLLAAVPLVALALTPVAGARAGAPAAPVDCGGASYGSSAPVSSTHYGVDKIKGYRTSCAKARAVALASEGHGGETYVSGGYRCRPGAAKNGLRPYTCTKIKKPKQGIRSKVTFRTWGNG
jgi:hypothetical protein